LYARLVDDTEHSRSSPLLKGSKDFVDEGSECQPRRRADTYCF
jgi:hypothetical protein